VALSDSEELAQALRAATHPIRLDLLEAFIERAVETPSEAAEALFRPVGHVRHHIRALARAGLLELCETRAVRDQPDERYAATSTARTLVRALSSVAS
jgi:predicted transcriptional regulator